jgi:hypothetical protein
MSVEGKNLQIIKRRSFLPGLVVAYHLEKMTLSLPFVKGSFFHDEYINDFVRENIYDKT